MFLNVFTKRTKRIPAAVQAWAFPLPADFCSAWEKASRYPVCLGRPRRFPLRCPYMTPSSTKRKNKTEKKPGRGDGFAGFCCQLTKSFAIIKNNSWQIGQNKTMLENRRK